MKKEYNSMELQNAMRDHKPHPCRYLRFMMRRHFVRLLRLRNLLFITVIIVLLYLYKTMGKLDADIPAPEALNAENIRIFKPVSLKKKDWHNYTQIDIESKRKGIGEQGIPAYLPKTDAHLEEQLYSVNGFNGALSDKIPLNRSLPDIRHHACQKITYIESLPTVSVVVPFHNEHWSTLLRTAHSVLHRSPAHLIKEVFLVDDASTKDFLGKELEIYLEKHMPVVRVLRLGSRRGLIAARLAGARRASADVLVFLDSHTEANVNWLPPLLEPIALDYRTVMCPFIDVVAYDTLEYRAQDEGARGAFDWELYYKRLPLLPADEADMPNPFQSPVMAGGLFAISRAFFWQLGGYDPGLDIWGGEQYELSFKIWQCGGRLLDAPCSRVGHIYRKFAPFPNPNHGDFVGRNYRRVAEVWMDEYAEYLYQRRPQYRRVPPGDLSRQHELRRALRCKPFRWFITQIAFDLTAKYPPIEPSNYGEGRISPLSNPELCLDARGAAQLARLALRPCAAPAAPAAEQEFVLTWHKDIKCKNRNMCWDLPESAANSPVLLYTCHLGGGNQEWRYRPETNQISHGSSCLDWDPTTLDVFVSECAAAGSGSGARGSQRWRVERVHGAALAQWDRAQRRLTAPEEPWP